MQVRIDTESNTQMHTHACEYGGAERMEPLCASRYTHANSRTSVTILPAQD